MRLSEQTLEFWNWFVLELCCKSFDGYRFNLIVGFNAVTPLGRDRSLGLNGSACNRNGWAIRQEEELALTHFIRGVILQQDRAGLSLRGSGKLRWPIHP